MSESIIRPTLGRDTYIAPTAFVAGQVTLGDECSVWHHVMIRGDVAAIRIGKRVNVQDGTVVHTETDVDLEIADDVAIGHRAVVHCRCVGRSALIGIGAIVLDRAEVGAGCIIAAGALVPPGMKIPDNMVAMGIPAKIVRETTDDERSYHRHVVERYVQLAKKHAGGVFPNAAEKL